MDLNLYGIAYPVHTLGPGSRIVIWVSGCSRKCPGCASTHLQEPTSGRLIAVERLARRMLAIPCHLDGITLTGGEPVRQTHALIELLMRINEKRPEWNVILFSGLPIEEIMLDEAARHLLSLVDILVDGPYDRNISATHPLAGSGNQRIHYLSERGCQLKSQAEMAPSSPFELGIGRGSSHMLIGIGTEEERAVAGKRVSQGIERMSNS